MCFTAETRLEVFYKPKFINNGLSTYNYEVIIVMKFSTAVAFEVNGILLPPSVVIAISNASTLTSIRCLGTEENVDISVELFESQDTNTGSYEIRTVSIIIYLSNNL